MQEKISIGYFYGEHADTEFQLHTFEFNSEPETSLTIPGEFKLHCPYPNPFNSNVKIEYELPIESSVNILVTDLTGRTLNTLVSGVSPPGSFQVLWEC